MYRRTTLIQTTDNADYFAVGNQYHTAIDNHTRYELKAGDYIEARTKSGQIIEYGRRDDASVTQVGIKTLYAIDSVYHHSLGGVSSDILKKIDYQYTNDGDYPQISRITYAGVSIDFSYFDSGISTPVVMGAYSGRFNQYIDTIDIQSPGASLLTRTYQLGYGYASSSFGYFLKTIQECGQRNSSEGVQTECTPALSLEWEFERHPTSLWNFAWPKSYSSARGEEAITAIIPFQWDKDDEMEVAMVTPEGVFVKDGNNIVSAGEDYPDFSLGSDNSRIGSPVVFDEDGDGVSELYFTHFDYDVNAVTYTEPQTNEPAGGYGCPATRSVAHGINGNTVTLPFDSHELVGKIVYCLYAGPSFTAQGGSFTVSARLTDRLEAPEQPTYSQITHPTQYTGSLKYQFYKWSSAQNQPELVDTLATFEGKDKATYDSVIDFVNNFASDNLISAVSVDYDADGLAELMVPYYTSPGYQPAYYKRLEDSTISSLRSRFVTADINRDGINEGISVSAGEIHIHNLGGGSSIEISGYSQSLDNTAFFLHDINGDGYKDLHFKNGARVSYYLGERDGFDTTSRETPLLAKNLFGKIEGEASYKQRFRLADLNKDGYTDLIFPDSETGEFQAWLANGEAWIEKVSTNINPSGDGEIFAVLDLDLDGDMDILTAYGLHGV